MNAATKAAPEGAVPVVLSPEEALDALTGRMSGICKQLVARVAFLERETLKKGAQLGDALDMVEEMRGQIRTKDEIINELQQLTAKRS